MNLEAPHAPPIFEISQDWVVAQSLYQHSSKPTQLRLQCQCKRAIEEGRPSQAEETAQLAGSGLLDQWVISFQ